MDFSLLEAALFICPMCKKITFITNDFFNQKLKIDLKDSKTNQNYQSNSSFSSKSLKTKQILIYKDRGKWKYYNEFNDLCKKLNSYPFLHFPVCSNCSYILFKHLNTMTQSTYSEIEILKKLTESEFLIVKNRLKSKIEENNNDIKKMKNNMNNNQQQTKEILKNKKDDCNNKQNDVLLPFYKRSQPVSPHFILASSFYISHYEQIGTINDLRLGLYYYEYIPVQEVNAALVEVCHLILNLSRILKRGNIDLKLSSNVLLPKKDSHGKIDYSLSLAITGYDHKRIQLFNEAIFILFSYVQSLYMISDGIFDPLSTPPYPIDLKEKKIGDYLFEVYTENLAMWNFPMKLLLLNLKCIQTQILMRDDL